MTIATQKTIQARIKAARHSESIAVFWSRRGGEDLLDAVCASTLRTRARIRDEDPAYLGTFFGPGGAERLARLLADGAAP